MRFTRTATLGRHSMVVFPKDLPVLVEQYGEQLPAWVISETHLCEGYSEPFMRFLGAEKVVSIDASDFEGATHVHDLNEPISGDLHEGFDAVIDGGTLEHVFNFPVAMRNAMEMVRPGGHMILTLPANNYCGHGFYQFSPELMYRVLSPENGFSIETMIATDSSIDGPWFEVADPARLRKRISLEMPGPTILMIRAHRFEKRPLFKHAPQQSDYMALWNKKPGVGQPPGSETAMLELRPVPNR